MECTPLLPYLLASHWGQPMGGPSRRSGVSDRESWGGACLHFHVTQLLPGELNLNSARPSNVSSLCFLDPEGGNMSPPLPALSISTLSQLWYSSLGSLFIKVSLFKPSRTRAPKHQDLMPDDLRWSHRFFFSFLLEDNCFTILCWPLPYINMNVIGFDQSIPCHFQASPTWQPITTQYRGQLVKGIKKRSQGKFPGGPVAKTHWMGY